MRAVLSINDQLLEYFSSDATGRGEWLAAHLSTGASCWIYLDSPAPQYLYLRGPGSGWRLVRLDQISNGPAAFAAESFSVQGGTLEELDKVGTFRFYDPALGGSSVTIDEESGDVRVTWRAAAGTVAEWMLSELVKTPILASFSGFAAGQGEMTPPMPPDAAPPPSPVTKTAASGGGLGTRIVGGLLALGALSLLFRGRRL